MLITNCRVPYFSRHTAYKEYVAYNMCYSNLHKRVSQGKRLSYHSVPYPLLPSLPNYPSIYPPKFAIMLNLALLT